MEQKFLFCFDFDETLTSEHILNASQLQSPEALKCGDGMRAFMQQALSDGHKIAITTRNNRENVERGLKLLGLENSGVIIVTDADVGFPDPGHFGKNRHIEKAQQLAGEGYVPVLVDDDEHNIERHNGLGLHVWQYDAKADILPPEEVMAAHVNSLNRILASPENAATICEEHAQFLDRRDLETGKKMAVRHTLPKLSAAPAASTSPIISKAAEPDSSQVESLEKKKGCLGFLFR